jgi:hypothetical protein
MIKSIKQYGIVNQAVNLLKLLLISFYGSVYNSASAVVKTSPWNEGLTIL